ncbi:MAG: AmmeMemoRadiSam system protein A [Christensenellales bacterium]|jgi:AmmeMemoRadiSam system protein A/AmmeMemoRadiSam system protein B
MSIIGAAIVPHPPLIVHEVGRGEEEIVHKTIHSYREVAKKIAAMQPETLVISSPHTVMYQDYFHISPGKEARGSLSQFGAPQVHINVEYDRELSRTICAEAKALNFPAGTLGERDPSLDHGTMVPLYFIRQYYKNFKIIRVGLSGCSLADHYRLGMMMQKAAEKLNRRVFYVASGDLSHKTQSEGPYGYDPKGPEYDAMLMEAAGQADFKAFLNFKESFLEQAAECGHRSFTIMAGALDKKAVNAEPLTLEEATGVGYGLCFYTVMGEDPKRNFLDQWEKEKVQAIMHKKASEDPYVRLARASVEHYVINGIPLPMPKDLPKEMTQTKAGVFVSLHKDGQLRGCIGTIHPVMDSVAEEIIENGISASTRDPRFNPVHPDELSSLEYSVDVLGEMEAIESKEKLDPKIYGVVVSRGGRRGLLLPNLEGVDTVEQQIDIARSKAGIPRGVPVQLERFRVIRHE